MLGYREEGGHLVVFSEDFEALAITDQNILERRGAGRPRSAAAYPDACTRVSCQPSVNGAQSEALQLGPAVLTACDVYHTLKGIQLAHRGLTNLELTLDDADGDRNLFTLFIAMVAVCADYERIECNVHEQYRPPWLQIVIPSSFETGWNIIMEIMHVTANIRNIWQLLALQKLYRIQSNKDAS